MFQTAFQINAFQNDAFQIAAVPPIVIIGDTHDGDYHKKKFEDEIAKKLQRKKSIIEAYEFLVEGKIPEVAEIVEPFVQAHKEPSNTVYIPQINFDAFLKDIDRVERLWNLYLDIEDEEFLLLS